MLVPSEIPTVGFYRELHCFLKKWPPTLSATKTTIGRFYTSIDPEFQRKNACTHPRDVYQLVEKMAASSKLSCSTLMIYSLQEHLQKVIEGCSAEVQKLTVVVSEHDEELSSMKQKVKIMKEEIGHAKHALKDIIEELQIID